MTQEKAIHELYLLKFTRNANWFTAELYRLIAKADTTNREKLRLGFPVEVGAWEAWYNSNDEREFFRSHGINI